ncbi:MAG: hypothetical protein ACOC8K_06545 [Gemmatimonadota bacterium]
MRRLLESWALVVAVAGLLAAHPAVLAAQSFAQGPSTIPADEAREFLGAWNLGITGAQGESIDLSIDIEDRDGQVVAAVAADGLSGAEPVSRIAREGERLTLSFMPVIQGQPIPVRIGLTPRGEELNADITAADGMFMASGTATRE